MAARFLGSRFRIPVCAGCSSLVFVVCCVSSCLCDELIARSDESHPVCVSVCVCVCLIVCHLETSKLGQSRALIGL